MPVNPVTQHAELKCLEKKQADEDGDRYPRHRVSNDDSVPEPAVRRQSVVLHQRAAVHVVGHHGRLPGIVPRSGRLANRCRPCLFQKPCDDSNSLCASLTLSPGRDGSLWLSMNNLVRNNAVTTLCCHRSDAEFVQFECPESNNGFCSEIFDYAWLDRVTRNSLTGQIATKRLRTNRNIASHKSR
jgi:hypothetical protein